MIPFPVRFAALVLLFLLPQAACTTSSSVRIETRSIEIGESQRTVRLVLPEKLSQPVPLVIAWHGFGDSPDSMSDYSELDQLAAKHRFVLAYPAGVRGSWRIPMPDAPNANVEKDVQLFDALVEQLTQDGLIDLDRIYLAGMSQGAIFAQWLASQRPEEIAAVAAHSGSPPQAVDLSTAKVPTLLIAGQQDLVHDSIRDDVTQYQAAGCEAKFLSVPNLDHAWSAAHNEAIWEFLSPHTRKNSKPD